MLEVVIKELKAKQSAFLLFSPPTPQWAPGVWKKQGWQRGCEPP